MTRPELAKQYFEEGCNCAQATFLAFSDLTKMDRDTALKISSSFGGGMGRLREVCGAVSGMFMAAGLLYATVNTDSQEEKAAHYARIQALAAAFKKKHGTIICRELLGVDANGNPTPDARTPEYYKSRPCSQLCYDAAVVLEEYIAANPL